MTPAPPLPLVDEHAVLVSRPPDAVWRTLVQALPQSSFRRTEPLVDLLGAQPRQAAGSLPEVGSALPGFEVTESVPGERLRLTGRHRFSTYALTFSVEPHGHATRLSARTEAAFPRLRGRVYRLLVIGSGAHRVLVVRFLQSVRRRAERTDQADP